MKRSTTLSTLALASALALAGCGSAGEEDTGAASETGTSAATGTAGATLASPSASPSDAPSGSAAGISAEHNDADVMFAQMMLPHHEQAVQMSEILLGKDLVPEDVRDLAERVRDTQAPEMEQMRAMLVAWDAPTTPDASATQHGGHGSGMVDDQGMNWLREAEEGPAAARLYLEQMTQHHEGAIEMARDQVQDGSNPQAVELAQEIVQAQEAEIAEMERMLQELPEGS
ncbi:DUF305 domain-containing protein [uncultured Kocuria sp.]|uniref:DUF305 domain-containing protein n=1 Tax=uncultured Kocuria sp. TaxID=259305 RepID=UPI002626AB1A|nr:DUF305 domain-containing protein [uncultured Kocuria sp.]